MDTNNLIDKYFEESLNAAEKAAFDDAMQNDTSFANEVAFLQQLKKGIHLQERSVLKQKLQAIEKNSVANPTKAKPFKWWLAAAAIVLIILSGVWVFNQKPDGNELFAAYYQPYPNTIAPLVRGEKNNVTDSLYNAFMAYEQKDFATATPLFNNLYKQTGKSHFIIYQAICLLGLHKTNEALTLLQQNKFEEEDALIIRNWYMALAYIQLNQFNDAKPLLKQISSSDNVFTTTAQTLLTKLP